MADEEISVSLNTAGYEVPLAKLTTAMNTFNTASVMATAQQKQMAKVMTDLGNIYSSYAKILVGTSKATALAVEGPSEALNKKFQNAQRVLANMDRELQKLQATGEKIAAISLVPKDLSRTGKAFGDAFGRVFKEIEQQAMETSNKVAVELQKVTKAAPELKGYEAELDALNAFNAAAKNRAAIEADYNRVMAGVNKRYEERIEATKALIQAKEREAAAEANLARVQAQQNRLAQRPDLIVSKLGITPISGATAGEQEKLAKAAQRVAAAFTDQTKTIESNEDAMEILKQTMLGVMNGTIQVDATNVKAVKALQDLMQLYSGVETRVEALTKAERDAAGAETLLVQRTQMVSAALHQMYDAAISSLPREQQQPFFKQLNDLTKTVAEGKTDLASFDTVLDVIAKDMLDLKTTTDSGTLAINAFNASLTKAGAKVGFADEIKKGVTELERAFKNVTGFAVTRMNPRQQQIMHDAFVAAARSANKLGMEVTDLTKIWAQYSQGTLRVDENNREVVNILNELAAANERAGMAVDEHTRQWQRFGQLVAARALTAAFYNMTDAIRSNIQITLDLSKAVGEIQTISHDMPLVYEKWAGAVRELSDEYNLIQTDVAEGIYQAISNQIGQGQQAIAFMHTAGAFSKATVSSMKDSIDLLSSALNAFQMPVSAANRVAAELFKTIELGRVRAADMADTLGRSAVLAHQAGISFEEYLSMIQQFTISGVQFSQSSTFIINVINKLMKPSEELKNLFKEWAVPSGQAAIQMYRLSGVVRKLLQETGGDLGELSEYIKDIRGTTGFAGLMSNIDSVESNIRETLKSTADYFQAIQETTTTTGHILTMEANKIHNELMAQMMTAEKLLVKATKVFNLVNMSAGEAGAAVLPAVMEGVIGVTALRLTAQAFAVESVLPKLIWRIGGLVTAVWVLYRLLNLCTDKMNSIDKVVEKGKKDAEMAAVNLSKINDQLVADIQKINQTKIQELAKQQELERAIIEKGLIQKKDEAKELMQIEQQARETRRDDLKKRIADLEQANKDADKYIDDLTRKYEEQRIEEHKSSPFTTPFEKFDITMQGAQGLFGQSMQQLAMAGTKEELQQASALFDSYMKQMTDARRIAQSELGNLEPIEIDQERDARFRQFVAAYRSRQQEITETELPQLRDQLNALNREVKNYAEASKLVNAQLDKNIKNEEHLIELLKIKVGLKATELMMSGQLGDDLRAVIAENLKMADFEQKQIKDRNTVNESALEAQRSMFEAFTIPESFKNMIGQMRGLAVMISGENVNAPIVQQVTTLEKQIEAMRQEFLATGTSAEERMQILQTTSPDTIRNAIAMGKILEKQVVGGPVFASAEGREMLTTLKDILTSLEEQLRYIESGENAMAIASYSDRAAKQATMEQQGYSGFPPIMHKGGWVPQLAKGGNVPAYLQAGEYVVDKETAAGWAEWQNWLQPFAQSSPGQAFDPVAAYENLQGQYQAMAMRDIELRGQWSRKQREMNLAGASHADIKTMKMDLKQQMANNVVQGPTGVLDLNTMSAAINALNNVPEMQTAYWNDRQVHLQNKFGPYKEQIDPRIAALQLDNILMYNSHTTLQKEYNRAINTGAIDARKTKLQEYMWAHTPGGVSPETAIARNEQQLAELMWLRDRVPNMKSPMDLMNAKTMGVEASVVAGVEAAANKTMEQRAADMTKAREMATPDTTSVGMRYLEAVFSPSQWLEPFKRTYQRGVKGQRAHETTLDAAFDVTGAVMGIIGAVSALAATRILTKPAASTLARRFIHIGRWGRPPAQIFDVGRGLVSGYPQVAEQIFASRLWGWLGYVPKAVVGNLAKAMWANKYKTILAGSVSLAVLTPSARRALLAWLKNEVVVPSGFGNTGTLPAHLAKGGFPGAPRGTDTVPAWLTPGEFVVNANASARYRGLLEQLNSFGGTTRPNFISPQYKQGGGSIGETKIYYNNNVTINHPTGNPALDATRVVQEINRQQSRGTARVRTR